MSMTVSISIAIPAIVVILSLSLVCSASLARICFCFLARSVEWLCGFWGFPLLYSSLLLRVQGSNGGWTDSEYEWRE